METNNKTDTMLYFDNIKKSNTLRKTYNCVCFLTSNKTDICIPYTRKDCVHVIRDNIGIPKKQEKEIFSEIYRDTFSKEKFEVILNSQLKDSIAEFRLLNICDILSKYLLIPGIYAEGPDINILGNKISNRKSLLKVLEIADNYHKEDMDFNVNLDKKKNDNDKRKKEMTRLTDLSEHFIYEDDAEEIVILDGVARVSFYPRIKKANDVKYPIEGLISGDGNVKWIDFDRSKFKPLETDKGTIYVLETLYYEDIKTFYVTKKVSDGFKVEESPYPIALLGDNKYAYYFKK